MSGVIAFASWSASSWPALALPLPLSLSPPPLPTTSSKSDTGDVCCAATANRTALLVVVPHKPASGNVGAVSDIADNTISTVLIRLPGDKGRPGPKWRCAPIIAIFIHTSCSLLLDRSGGPGPLVSVMGHGKRNRITTENGRLCGMRQRPGRNIRGVFQRGWGVIGG